MQAPKLPGLGFFIAWFIFCVIGGLSVLGFIMYMIWLLVQKFVA